MALLTIPTDVLYEILCLLDIQNIGRLIMTSKLFQKKLALVISKFKFTWDPSHRDITDDNLKYLNNVYKINLLYTMVSDNGMHNLSNTSIVKISRPDIYLRRTYRKYFNDELMGKIPLIDLLKKSKFANPNPELRITDAGLEQLQSVTYLKISHNNSIRLKPIPKLRNLRKITIDHCKIPDDNYEYLSHLDKVKLYDIVISDKILYHLRNVRYVKLILCTIESPKNTYKHPYEYVYAYGHTYFPAIGPAFNQYDNYVINGDFEYQWRWDLGYLQYISKLYIAYCDFIEPRDLAVLGQLQRIKIKACAKIDYVDVMNMPNVKVLDDDDPTLNVKCIYPSLYDGSTYAEVKNQKVDKKIRKIKDKQFSDDNMLPNDFNRNEYDRIYKGESKRKYYNKKERAMIRKKYDEFDDPYYEFDFDDALESDIEYWDNNNRKR